jgi:adenylosuccinate lyase
MSMTATAKNLQLPGNPRYQPKNLIEYFGYDNMMRYVGEVEIATLRTLAETGKIPADVWAPFNDHMAQALLEITTTEVDEVERSVTQHDIRAWVHCAQAVLRKRGCNTLADWVHIPLTSYDPICTARALQFKRAWNKVIKPAVCETLHLFSERIEEEYKTVQIGRTHLQHALPITVGFWLATIADRIMTTAFEMARSARHLVGKISGAVGAHNAQIGLGFSDDFEEQVLKRLELSRAWISTQIVPPESLAQYLHAACLLSAALGQFGRDCRNLMRPEIGEVSEPFAPGQVGSSTMAHKRNPITFEQLEGMWIRNRCEYHKVLETLISDLQRDLTGSSVERDFPIILVNLMTQLNGLLKEGKKDKRPFLRRMHIDQAACQRNFKMSAHLILSEPLQIALSMAGYEGDAHELVNHVLTPKAAASGRLLVKELEMLAKTDAAVGAAYERIPKETQQLLHRPEQYIGDAPRRALQIAREAETFESKLH